MSWWKNVFICTAVIAHPMAFFCAALTISMLIIHDPWIAIGVFAISYPYRTPPTTTTSLSTWMRNGAGLLLLGGYVYFFLVFPFSQIQQSWNQLGAQPYALSVLIPFWIGLVLVLRRGWERIQEESIQEGLHHGAYQTLVLQKWFPENEETPPADTI